MTDIRAVDLPELRSGLVQHLESEYGVAEFRQHFGATIRMGTGDDVVDSDIEAEFGAVELSSDDLRKSAISTLRKADLFFVSSEMTELAKVSAASLDSFKLDAHDFPSASGFVAFEEPYALYEAPESDNPPAEIVAAAWRIEAIDGGEFLEVTYYSDWYRYLDAVADRFPVSQVEQARALGYRIYFETFNGGELGTKSGSSAFFDQHFGALFKPLVSVWLLMGQPLASITEVDTYRAARKRLRRLGEDPAAVRVIQLRRASHSTGASESDREYHHQWIVRGHWRQQWYPSREVHRPVWIAPHIKGPEGAPLIGGEKVHALVR